MNRNSILIACATNDRENLINDHFGEAKYFMIYRLYPDRWEHVETITNQVTGEYDHSEGGAHHHRHGHGHSSGHGEGDKAMAILENFKERQADVFISRRFGPNIVTVRQYILPVVIRNGETLEEGLRLCQEYFKQLVQQLNVPPRERKHLILSS